MLCVAQKRGSRKSPLLRDLALVGRGLAKLRRRLLRGGSVQTGARKYLEFFPVRQEACAGFLATPPCWRRWLITPTTVYFHAPMVG